MTIFNNAIVTIVASVAMGFITVIDTFVAVVAAFAVALVAIAIAIAVLCVVVAAAVFAMILTMLMILCEDADGTGYVDGNARAYVGARAL